MAGRPFELNFEREPSNFGSRWLCGFSNCPKCEKVYAHDDTLVMRKALGQMGQEIMMLLLSCGIFFSSKTCSCIVLPISLSQSTGDCKNCMIKIHDHEL